MSTKKNNVPPRTLKHIMYRLWSEGRTIHFRVNRIDEDYLNHPVDESVNCLRYKTADGTIVQRGRSYSVRVDAVTPESITILLASAGLLGFAFDVRTEAAAKKVVGYVHAALKDWDTSCPVWDAIIAREMDNVHSSVKTAQTEKNPCSEIKGPILGVVGRIPVTGKPKPELRNLTNITYRLWRESADVHFEVVKVSPVYTDYAEFQYRTHDKTLSTKFKTKAGPIISYSGPFLAIAPANNPPNDLRIGIKPGVSLTQSMMDEASAEKAIGYINAAIFEWDSHWWGFRYTNQRGPGYDIKLSHLTYRLWRHGSLFGFQVLAMDERFRTTESGKMKQWTSSTWPADSFMVLSGDNPYICHQKPSGYIIGLRGINLHADDHVVYLQVQEDASWFKTKVKEALAKWNREWFEITTVEAPQPLKVHPLCYGMKSVYGCTGKDCESVKECAAKSGSPRHQTCFGKYFDSQGYACKYACSDRDDCQKHSTRVEPVRVASENAPKCNLRYELWNVENVVMVRILEQNYFESDTFRASNGFYIYVGGNRGFEQATGSLWLTKEGVGGMIASWQCGTKEAAEERIAAMNQALLEWGQSLRKDKNTSLTTNIHEV